MTRRVVRRGRHRRVRRPGHGRRRRRRRASTLDAVHRFPNGAVDVDGHLRWDLTGLFGEVLDGLRGSPRSSRTSSRSASTPGASTTGCSTPTATCSPSRSPTATTAPATVDRRRARARRRPTSCTRINGLQFLPFNTHLPARGRAARRAVGRRRARRAAPRPARLLADRRAAHRGHQRVDHRARRRPHRHVVRPSCSTGSTSPPTLLPPIEHPGEPRAAAPDVADRSGCRVDGRHHRRLARHRVGRRRRAGRRPTASPTSPAARGRSSGSSSTRRSLTDDGTRRELHQRGAASTAAPGSCATSAACGCSRSACAPGPSGTRRPRRAPRRGRPRSPPAARASTSTTPRSSRPATCPTGSRAAAGRRRHSRRRPRSSAASSTPSPTPTPARSTEAAALAGTSVDVVHIVGGGSQNELLCQLHRRRRRAARSSPGRSRRPRSATCSSRPAPTARCAGIARSDPRALVGRVDARCGGTSRSMSAVRDPAVGRPVRARSRPIRSSGGWPRPRRSPTCAASPSAGCPAACSTTSTAAPRTSAPSRPTRPPSPASTFRPRVLRGLDEVDTGVDAARPAARLPARARADRLHPHRRSRGRARRRPGRANGPACPTRCRR